MGSSSRVLLLSAAFHPLQQPAPTSYFVLALGLHQSFHEQIQLPHPAGKNTCVFCPPSFFRQQEMTSASSTVGRGECRNVTFLAGSELPWKHA